MTRPRETFVPLFSSARRGQRQGRPKRRRVGAVEWGGLLVVLLLAGIAVWQLGSTQPSYPLVSARGAFFSPPPPAELAIITRFKGPARVTGGDSLTVEGEHILLFGVDAPDPGETCTRADGRSWPCGAEATAALRRLVAGAHVVCAIEYRDGDGRAVSTCHADAIDVGAAMVKAGLALADRRHSKRYVADEAEARRYRAGLWDASVVVPAGGPEED